VRLLFVCNKGHIFRSLRSMKRLRQCPTCRDVVQGKGHQLMSEARKVADARPFGRDWVQVFDSGRIVAKKREAA
jgi:hypothetical protein